MKIFGKYLLMSAIAVGLWSCSDDAPEVNNPDESVDEVYMSVRIQLPTSGGSRSTTTGDNTSSDGTEVGKSFENNVSTVLLVLAEPGTNKYISHKVIDNPTQDGSTVSAKGTFNKSMLVTYLNSSDGNNKISLFAFCNYTDKLKEAIETIDPESAQASTWFNDLKHDLVNAGYSWSNQASNEAIWRKESFLMANESLCTGYLPTLEELNAGKYNSASEPCPLTGTGSIRVQRSVARFDFMDGSPETTAPNTYNFATTSDNDPTLQITLTHMSLVNLSKQFYHLIRTSQDGKPNDENGKDQTNLCGADNTTDWVVDTDAAQKVKGLTMPSNNFYYWTDANDWNPSNWDTIEISELANHEDQNFEGWIPGENGKERGYKIWRYATENTIPSLPRNQRNGISTGVIFQGILTCTDNADESIRNAMEEGEPLYAFDGKFYGSWESVGEFAAANAGKPAYTDMIAAYNNCKESTSESDRVANGFAIYRYDSTLQGYPMHYYYWNRHDDNGNPAVMGHMEFQVVRNNIYKLRVTDIKGLGHPTKPGDDPDPFDPEDPDEEENVYFTVKVAIVPWVVRVNDITFP